MSCKLARRTSMVMAIGLTVLVGAAPAAARTAGKQSFRGVIVASGQSGTRVVVSSLIVGRGVVRGVGRVVEVANRAGDPDTVSRDNLVFRRGSLHLVSTTKSFRPSIDPSTCAETLRIRQTQRIDGGTGAFRHASGRFFGGIRGYGVGARNPDGTCSEQLPSLLEVAAFSMRGRLSL
jgi:hypothetical protein